MLTSMYLTQFQDSASLAGQSEASFDDELFHTDTGTALRDVQRQAIRDWLSAAGAKVPELTEGLNESIVSWFLQSAYLLPSVLQLPSAQQPRRGKQSTSLSSALQLLIQSKCLKDSTISYLQKSSAHAPPPDLIWRILEDVHDFAVDQPKVTVPLLHTEGTDRPVVLDSGALSGILKSLNLPPLPPPGKQAPLEEDSFRNGQFLLDVYCVLERVPDVSMKPAKTIQQAVKNTEDVLRMFEEKKFVDHSFVLAAPLLANGSRFVLQQLLSMIFWNVSRVDPRTQAPIVVSPDHVLQNRLDDGVTLPKLLSAIDANYAHLGCIFAEPTTEAERKWNVRKSVEFLQKKPGWTAQVDPGRLFGGFKRDVEALFEGLKACYRAKFGSLSSISCLRETLGLNPKL
jgi:hypothetical protein